MSEIIIRDRPTIRFRKRIILHAVHAGGGAEDGSLFGMRTYCGIRVGWPEYASNDHGYSTDNAYTETTPALPTCKTCLRAQADEARKTDR